MAVESTEGKKRVASYTKMEDGTREDYEMLVELSKPFRAGVADRVLKYFDTLHEGFPGERVDRYEHSLQTATRAFRDGQNEEVVVASLLHDLGDQLAPDNHAEFGATILCPYVTPSTHWMMEKHGIFQGYYYFHHIDKDRHERERYRDHPAYQKTVEFCHKYDQASFDPHYDTMPLSAFEAMVRQILERPAWGPHTKIGWTDERAYESELG